MGHQNFRLDIKHAALRTKTFLNANKGGGVETPWIIRRLPLVLRVQVCQATHRGTHIHYKSSETKHNELKRLGQNLEACPTLKLVCRSQLNCLVVWVKAFWQPTDIVARSKTITWLWQHPPASSGKLEVIAAWGELSVIVTLPEAAQKPSGMTGAPHHRLMWVTRSNQWGKAENKRWWQNQLIWRRAQVTEKTD